MTILAEIQKNPRGEVIRVARDVFKGRDRIDVRVWFPAEDGKMCPGKGLSIQPQLLDEVIAGLQKARSA